MAVGKKKMRERERERERERKREKEGVGLLVIKASSCPPGYWRIARFDCGTRPPGAPITLPWPIISFLARILQARILQASRFKGRR